MTGLGATATQDPATVSERITGVTARKKGDKLMTPERTSGAGCAREEGR